PNQVLTSFPTRRSSDLFSLSQTETRTRRNFNENHIRGLCPVTGSVCSSLGEIRPKSRSRSGIRCKPPRRKTDRIAAEQRRRCQRSEEHTSELQSLAYLV